MQRMILVMAALAALAAGASAQAAPRTETGRSWPEEKCARYGEAWTEAIKRFGTRGLGQDFLDTHAAFLASGCTSGDVCPRSQEELDLANVMVIRAMNAGTASTFPPFRCRR
ncbi:MAG: hypothetical protein ABWY78_13565 [Microvirga sp.]